MVDWDDECCAEREAQPDSKLRQKLALCPICELTKHIEAIKRYQKRWDDRYTSEPEEEPGLNLPGIGLRWSRCKLSLMKLITRFERLLVIAKSTEKFMGKLRAALALWEANKAALTRCPGLKYAEEQEEDDDVARILANLPKLIREREMTGEDKTYTSLSQRKLQLRQLHQKQLAAQPTSALAAEPKPSSLSQSSATKPILKRKHSAAFAPSPPAKRLRIADEVTISPQGLNITNPSPFSPLPSTPTSAPHNEHTDASKKRRSSRWNRRAPVYTPGAWASGDAESKANTSNFSRSWENTERATREEMQEAEEERRVVQGLKVVSGAWMGVWWVQRVYLGRR
jgi:hypothetical protein